MKLSPRFYTKSAIFLFLKKMRQLQFRNPFIKSQTNSTAPSEVSHS